MISTEYLLLFAASVFLALVASWSVVSPFFSSAAAVGNERERQLANLYEEKESLLQGLEELEIDFSNKKTSEEDYQATKSELSLKVAKCFKQIDEIENDKS